MTESLRFRIERSENCGNEQIENLHEGLSLSVSIECLTLNRTLPYKYFFLTFAFLADFDIIGKIKIKNYVPR